jgi:hypothetical protein
MKTCPTLATTQTDGHHRECKRETATGADSMQRNGRYAMLPLCCQSRVAGVAAPFISWEISCTASMNAPTSSGS